MDVLSSQPTDDILSEPLSVPDLAQESDEESASPRTQILSNLDQEMLNETAINSGDIQDQEDFLIFTEDQKTNKRDIRSSRIAKKAEEKFEMVKLMKEQNVAQEQSNQVRMASNILMMKMMNKLVGALDSVCEPKENIQEEINFESLCQAQQETKQRLDQLDQKMNEILVALKKMINLLREKYKHFVNFCKSLFF